MAPMMKMQSLKKAAIWLARHFRPCQMDPPPMPEETRMANDPVHDRHELHWKQCPAGWWKKLW